MDNDNRVKVAVGIACSGSQSPMWWSPLMHQLLDAERDGIIIHSIIAISSALPDFNKNAMISFNVFDPTQKDRAKKTDSNRVEVVDRFLESDADYLFFLDDDTVHPQNTLQKLLAARRDFIGGVYFNPSHPHNPIAYLDDPDKSGFYAAFMNYPRGTMIQVDAIGMGCTLIHRSVFEKIMAAHTVFQRPDGSIIPVLNENILGGDHDDSKPDVYAENGEVRFKMVPLKSNNGARYWPFFGMEYGRTEDFWFCELARKVGVKPWLDTSIECDHWKLRPTNGKDFWPVVNKEWADKPADLQAGVLL